MNMFRYVTCILIVLTCACAPRTFGPSSSAENPPAVLNIGKGALVVIAAPDPSEADENTLHIATRLARIIRPFTSFALPMLTAMSKESALAQAKSNNAEYIFFIRVEKWRSIPFAGQDVSLFIDCIHGETGQILTSSPVTSRCYMYIMGMEPSPARCIQDELTRWLAAVYGANPRLPSEP